MVYSNLSLQIYKVNADRSPRTPLTAVVIDKQTHSQTDGQTDRHNKGALGLLVLNTLIKLKLSLGFKLILTHSG